MGRASGRVDVAVGWRLSSSEVLVLPQLTPDVSAGGVFGTTVVSIKENKNVC